MKKAIFTVSLLVSPMLWGMEEDRSFMEDPRLVAVRECINKIAWVDAGVKEDISVTDPEAFAKIVQYADLLLDRLVEKSTVLSLRNGLTEGEFFDLAYIQTKVNKMKEEYQGMKNANAQEVSSQSGFLMTAVMQAQHAKEIELWNVMKKTLLVFTDILHKKMENF